MTRSGKVTICSACGCVWGGAPCAWCGGWQSVRAWPPTAAQIARDYETLTRQAREARPRDPETLKREIGELFP